MNWSKAGKERIKRRNFRILMVGCFFTFCYAIIGAKTFYIQVVTDADLSRQASGQYQKGEEHRGRRGGIYDRNMKELVASTRITSVGAHPEAIAAPARVAPKIAGHLDVCRGRIESQLRKKATFVWLDRDASPMQAEALKKQRIRGLEYIPGYCRIYPNKSLAAQVLGFAGVDQKGLEGLEYYYDGQLQGNSKRSTIIRDAMGRIFHRRNECRKESDGNNLVLTLDSNIQYITEKALESAVRKNRARSGMAVVMVPQTGAIRAIAHYPTFDPNNFAQYPTETWRNRAISDSFEPGSTMKVFTVAAALEAGICDPDSVIDCENGRYRTGGHVINDIHAHERLKVSEVIKYSSNIGATKIAEQVGGKRLYETLRAFGFGEKTGIDCPGETSGRLRHYQGWRTIDQATIAFGQGITVSAVQLLSAISAIANDGVVMKPRLVKAITDKDGRVIKKRSPESRGRAISAETAAQLKNMMFAVTGSEGTGSQAVPPGYTVCGKTGTAQKINASGTYENCEYNGLFVGFSPRRSPELAVLVVIDEPQKHHYGGVVAAPAFRSIIFEAFNYMDIPRNMERQHYEVSAPRRERGA